MSHFDDIEPLFYGGSGDGGGGGAIAALLFLLLVAGACIWAFEADDESANDCAAHGEKYIDSRLGYTLCEQDGGTVVRR